jgi:flagellar hook-associated protein 3 FlgL
LANNDEPGITIAGSNLEDDLDDIINARAVVGVQSKALQDTQTRAEDQKLQEQSMLSNLRDADLAEVISRYQQLQVQLQASLQMTAQSLQLSLMDFLR